MNASTVVQRVIFPARPDPDALALYLDADDWSSDLTADTPEARFAKARGFEGEGSRNVMRLTERSVASWVDSRRSMTVPAGQHVSLGTYFNAFPASYWSRWTVLTGVDLRIRAHGHGQVVVYRSNARGVIQREQTVAVDGDADLTFALDFRRFLDGGWYWFDLVAGDGDLVLDQADWCAPDAVQQPRNDRATVCITTLNRTDYCTRLVAEIGADDEAAAVLDEVLVIDQGTERINDADGLTAAREALGSKLRVIEQENLGGSGGFARGMFETVRSETSGYALLLDDDVEIEPESIRRAVTFANHCTRPTIVGGHMFDMYDKSKLHAFAEGVRSHSFMWGPYTPSRHDLADSNLRQTTWLHRRFDVDYNGWWMCLIPVEVIRDIGLALPAFIKWDDAEYALRAREYGYSTVSLPGAAVWHVSWVDKDDTHDWQAFFHARNRLVAALLHSPHPGGGALWRDNLSFDVKNLLSMDYYTVAMRHEAFRSVLSGPGGLHRELPTRIGQIRALGERFREAHTITDTDALPRFAAREIPSVRTGEVEAGPRGAALAKWLITQLKRHGWSPVRRSEVATPKAHLAFQDARWFQVPGYDSVLVSNAEGSGATWHVRQPKTFRRMLATSIRLNRAYQRRWSALRAEYRAALHQITSMAAWAETFGVDLD